MNITLGDLCEIWEKIKGKQEIKRLESLNVYQKAKEIMDKLSEQGK